MVLRGRTRPPAPTEPMVQFNAIVPLALRTAIRLHCIQQDESVGAWTRRVLEAAVVRERGAPPRPAA